MKAIIFARVSSREQEETGYSLPAQKKLLEDYAQKKEFNVAKVFSISESASGRYQRKTFNELLQYVEKNKVNIILCEKIDRLTRNLKDAALIDDWVKKDNKNEVHFAKESFILNCNTKAHENLVWDMKVAIARFYTNNLSEEVKKGQKEKLAQGWIPMHAKLGYKTTGERGHKIHVTDEPRAVFVRKMFELYATGNYSINALVSILYKEGLRNESGRRVGKSRMHKLLSDPFYCGKMRWNDIIYNNGQHESLISKELFDQVQEKLVRKTSQPQYRKHLPVFKAKIKCNECGGVITWEIQKGHWYGHCNHYRNCSQRNFVRQEDVEKQLFPFFDGVAPRNEMVLKWLERALKEDHADEIKCTNSQRDELNKTVERLDRRLGIIYEDKIDQKISADFYEKKFEEYTAQKEDALDSLKKLSESRTKYYEAGYAIHELARKAKDIYLSPKATVEQKRLLLSYVFSDSTLNDDKITPNYTLAFEFLAEWMPTVNPIFEPEQKTAKSFIPGGILSMEPLNHALEPSEAQNDFRTSKKSPVKPQPEGNTLTLRPLLRW